MGNLYNMKKKKQYRTVEKTSRKGQYTRTYIVHQLLSSTEDLDLLSCCRQCKEERQISGEAPRLIQKVEILTAHFLLNHFFLPHILFIPPGLYLLHELDTLVDVRPVRRHEETLDGVS